MKNRGNNQKTIKQLKPKHSNNKYIKYKWSKKKYIYISGLNLLLIIKSQKWSKWILKNDPTI